MADQITVVDDKVEVTKTITTELVETFTQAQLEESILNYQNQIIYLQQQILEKQNLLTHF